jgi:DNA repair protein RadC
MLYVKQPSGRYSPASDEQVFERAADLRLKLFPRRTPISAPSDAQSLLREKLAHLQHEEFVLVYLDTRHRLIAVETLFRGTIDGATVYPREVVKRALALNASAVILAHNHPSGVAEPSEADRSITLKLAKALSLVEVRLLDHLVVGADRVTSMAERGLI